MALARRMRGVIDLLLTPAADPRQTFADPQTALLHRIHLAHGRASATARRLEGRMSELHATLPRHWVHARLALQASHEAVARMALERRHVDQAELAALETQLAEVHGWMQRLELVEAEVRARISAAQVRHDLALARLSTAEAHAGLDASVFAVSADVADLEAILEGALHQADYLNARASAIEQLHAVHRLDSQPVGRFSDTPASQSVEAELELLWRSLAAEAS